MKRVHTSMNQRWLLRRSLYRPPDERINTAEYDVAEIPGDHEARSFIETHHYSRSYPAARFRFGLYRRGHLSGVAVFSVPCSESVLTSVFRLPPSRLAELGRFVLLDSVAGNGETWFLARCFAHLRSRDLAGIVSFSDPLPRRSLDGQIVHKGHVGTIYQTFNGTYLGRSAPRTIRLLPDGSVLNARTIQKIRAQERGWRYGAKLLEGFGATPVAGDPGRWLREWLPKLTRPVRHPGNHKYAWALNPATQKTMATSLPFPKLDPLFYSKYTRLPL